MSRDPPDPDPPRHPWNREHDPTGVENELRELTTTAAHELALLRDAIADRPHPPPALSKRVAAARETLRRSVVAYVQSLRVEGASPVDTILRVKSAVEPQLKLPSYERRACVDDVVRWTVEAYYDT
jgi:hypothetical protein